MKYIRFMQILVIFIILSILIILWKTGIKETYMSDDPNFRDGVFIVRPPNEIARLYKPFVNLSPTFQYVYNDIPMPRTG